MKLLNQATVVTLIGTSLVAGCSSDGDSNTPAGTTLSGNVSKIGNVVIADANNDFMLDMIALFTELQAPVSVSLLEAELGRRVTSEDDCEVFVGIEGDYVLSEIETAFVGSTLISAGEVITVSSAGGSLGELQQSVIGDSDFVTYTGEIQASQESASGLIVDIPGGDFPAFGAIAFPEVAPFVLTTDITPTIDFNTEFAIDSTFTWDPISDEDSRITLLADSITESNQFEGLSRTRINCVLVDDGSFTFGADVQAQLTNFGFTSLPLAFGRESFTIHQQGDSVLFTSRTSGIGQ